MLTSPAGIDPCISLGETGLVFGAETRLAQFAGASDRLFVDHERLKAMFAVAFQRAPSSRDLAAIEAASSHWQRGDKALANLRLVVAELPRLEEAEQAIRLKAAELLYDAGLRGEDLEKAFDADPSTESLDKYDPDQPRVPAGSGEDSGRWTTSLWSRFSSWLGEQVPERDQDTGLQVGTQSRARAILGNPLTVGIVAAGALFGGEALLPAAAAGAAAAAPEAGAAAVAPAAEGAAIAVP